MNFSIAKSALVRTLETVAPIAAKKQSILILANAKCVIKGNRIRFHAFDSENAVRCYADLESADSAGEFLINPADILRYAKTISADTVTFDIADAAATISHGRNRATFPAPAADQYPDTWDDTDALASIAFPDSFIESMIADGKAFVGTDDFFPHLKSVHVFCQDGSIGYAATDTRKMVANSISADPRTPQPQAPVSTLIHQAVLPLIPTADCTLILKEKHTILDFGSVKICAALPQGKFPDFRRVMPQSAAVSVEIPTAEFRSIIRRLRTLAPTGLQSTTFRFGILGAEITTQDIGTGRSASEFMECPAASEFTVAFSLPLLSDIVSRVSSDTFTLGFVGPGRPVLFTEASAPNRAALLMPISLPR